MNNRRNKAMRRALVESLWHSANAAIGSTAPYPAMDDKWVQETLIRVLLPEKRVMTRADVVTALLLGFVFGLIFMRLVG